MNSHLLEETRVPGKSHRLTPIYWKLSHMPKIGTQAVVRKWVIIGNDLDHTAMLIALN